MSESLGWGIVGTADVAQQVASDLRLLDSAHLAAVCSRSADRARAFADEHGVANSHGDVDELLADDAVDIVYLATPHSAHSTLAIRSLEAGKHVLVEKPLGIDAADVAKVADAARTAGRFAMEGMWMKFHPYYRALIAEVRSGVVGDVVSVRASFGLPFGAPDAPLWSAELASSTLLDQGIYPVTLAYDVLGAPSAVHASARRRDDGVDLVDIATLHYAGGRFAQIAASMVGYLEPTASISGVDGWLTIPPPFWATDRYTRHVGGIRDALMAPESVAFSREGFGYVPMLRAVSDAIADGLTEHPTHTLAHTLAVAEILDDIRRDAARNPDLQEATP